MSEIQFLELPKGALVALTKVTPGLWHWKEDTRSLEFVSAQFKEETKELKEKTKKGGKAIHFQDTGAKPMERYVMTNLGTPGVLGLQLPEAQVSTPADQGFWELKFKNCWSAKIRHHYSRPSPSLFRNLYAIQPPFQDEKPARLGKRGQNELITLEDVKYAALFLAHEDESVSIPSFSVVMRCKQLDDFLMALLYYVSFYLEKIALEKKPKSAMGNPSAMEKKAIKQNQINLAVTKKHLAEVYCILILGLGMSEQHHMACGKRKISTSQKDREFFECLYRFAAYVAFVTFRQKNLKEIQEEVGRLLRSNIFNPALREKTQPEEFLKIALSTEVKKNTLSFRKQTNIKHPAIRSVMDTRSPVLSTLLPMPKDSAQYLFRDHYLHPGKTASSFSPEELPELSSIVTASNIGIIGCQRNKFIPHTLQPIGSLEDVNADRESLQSKTSVSSIMAREATSSTKSTHSTGSRQSMVISRTTTEADYSERPSKHS